MIRLTLVLLAGIGITLSVAGTDPDALEGTAPGAAHAQGDPAQAGPASRRPLALDDEAGAIERALAAKARSDRADTASGAVLWNAVADGAQASARTVGPAARTDGGGKPSDILRVNADRVNVRAGPSTANQVLDQVVRDQRIEVLETLPSGWARIHVPETGLTAWIFDRFLSPAG